MATRVKQRERTRQGIIGAAAELLGEGNADPSIDEIAEQAAMSRATVYRYFADADDIIWQAFADLSVPGVEETLAGIDDPAVRVERVEQVLNDYVFADPGSTRAFERALLGRTDGHDADGRPARRIRYLEAALQPLRGRLPDDRIDLLRHSLSLTIGTQAVIALIDVCELSVEEARDVTRFTAGALVHAALDA